MIHLSESPADKSKTWCRKTFRRWMAIFSNDLYHYIGRMKHLLISGFVLISFLSYSQTTILVVRHAEKETSSSGDPDLSAEGKARAATLDRMLREVSVNHVFSTTYKRTRQTVTPLAERLGVEVRDYNPSAQEAFAAALKKYEGQTILVAGHSNTVPALVNHLIGERKYQDLPEDEYDNLYIVTITTTGAKVICLKYGGE